MAKELDAVQTTKDLLLLQKEIENQYSTAKVKSVEEANNLTNQIVEKEAEAKELYTMMVLSQIEVSVYQTSKNELDLLKDLLQLTNKKVEDINSLMLIDIREKCYNPYLDIKNDFRKANAENKLVANRKMYKAKETYLNAIHAQKPEIAFTENVLIDIEKLEKKLGMNSGDYRGLSHYTDALINNEYNGQVGLEVDRGEVKQAFESGTLHKNLKQMTE